MKTFNIYFLVILLLASFQINNVISQDSYAEEQIDEEVLVVLDGNTDGTFFLTLDAPFRMQMYPRQHVLGIGYNPYCTSSDLKYFGRYRTNCKNSIYFLTARLIYALKNAGANGYDDISFNTHKILGFQIHDSGFNFNLEGSGVSKKSNSTLFYEHLYAGMKERADEIVRQNKVAAYNKNYALRLGRTYPGNSNSQNQRSSGGSNNNTQRGNTYRTPSRNSNNAITKLPPNNRGSGSSQFNKSSRGVSALSK